MASSTSLRAVTHRLTATPVKELPQIAAHLATSLGECGKILSAPQNQKAAKSASETALLVHKLKTRVTSLLQDQSIEGRWSGIILVKAVVEVGQWEILRGCEPWVRSLIAILNKPDPASMKRLCIITLTRIFHLTHQYQTLVRELTTPSLPSFITACMNVVSVKSSSEPTRKLRQKTPLLGTVLHALLELMPWHPTIFRPFSSQIHSLVLPFVGSVPSISQPDVDAVINLSQQLFISLHHCAPKNTSADEWAVACKSTVGSVHRTADHLFRAVIEQWESTDAARNQTPKRQNLDGVVSDDGPDCLGLPGWKGLQAGAERLKSLLNLLSEFISTGSNSAVSIPLGLIIDLTSRLNSITVPFEDADGLQNTVQYNSEIAKEEREDLLIELPTIHSQTLNLLLNIVESFGNGIAPVAQNILEQTLWVFGAEKFNKDVRTATYSILRILLPILGPSVSRSTISALSPVMRSCCHDLSPPPSTGKPEEHGNLDTKAKPVMRTASTNADSFLSPKLKGRSITQGMELSPGLVAAASSLLPSLLHYLPVEHISTQLRADVDRTATLTNNQKAMVASVINPGLSVKGRRENPSIAPFLARIYPMKFEVESFLRPRMPVLLRGSMMSGKLVDAGVSEAEAENYESTVPEYVATSGNMFRRPSDVTSSTDLFQETEQVSNYRNKRSYPTDPGASIVETQPTSIMNVQEPEGLRAKVPKVANGFAHHETVTRESLKPTPSTTSDPIMYDSVTEQLQADPSPSTSSDAGVVRVNVTHGGSSTMTSSGSYLTEGMSNVKSHTEPVAGANSITVDVSSVPAARGVEDDSSGDEIPTLNIEPDTDDEDDQDIEMGG